MVLDNELVDDVMSLLVELHCTESPDFWQTWPGECVCGKRIGIFCLKEHLESLSAEQLNEHTILVYAT